MGERGAAPEAASLGARLHALTASLGAAELHDYQLLLGAAIKGLAPDGLPPTDALRAAAFGQALAGLARVQPPGLLWRGRPTALTAARLTGLRHEAMQQHASAGSHGYPVLRPGGAQADALAVSPALTTLVEKHAGPVMPTGVTRFAFYAGAGPNPLRLDPETFMLHALVVLAHDAPDSPPPRLLLQRAGAPPARIGLCPGDLLLFRAGSTPHAVEPGASSELASLLWLLFQPAGAPRRLAPYVPTPLAVAERMLTLAETDADDLVYDLGCGDGRLVALAAGRFGARAVGVERDTRLASAARARIRADGLAGRARIVQGEAAEADVREATVVTLFLNAETNEQLRPLLERDLPAGARVVCHQWPIRGWEADAAAQLPGADALHPHRLYLYRR